MTQKQQSSHQKQCSDFESFTASTGLTVILCLCNQLDYFAHECSFTAEKRKNSLCFYLSRTHFLCSAHIKLFML